MADKPKTILVVDDDPQNRDLLARRLERQGFEVETARDGLEGLRRIEADDFHLVMLDVMMPGMNGLEVLEIVNNSNIVHTTQGPFPITILPGAIHPPSSIITGVLDEYVAGETVEAVTLNHHKLETRTLSLPS